ncbi:PREDICTED: uncharacterized protein LOC105953389 [Erythranthe guttata]|uniref:uncharacterized protein LOC105953389 n=1 Tax=Erythranthe guttata TaxID=4155 RepID=UPI00064DCC16|nr:PREDICTED: uncharacterized protein LOC105953389 [Erythranthe guttata]|eukprot:XP_012832503.1 PREDICTED: uncharacterized protein LOC105953389 [Erythranthe guttata]
MDAGFIGNPFTWSNNRTGPARIWKRLDRILVSPSFHLSFPNLKVVHLERTLSDHAPLCVSFEQLLDSVRTRFIFQRMWVDHSSFLEIVKKAWTIPVFGSPSYIFQQKMHNVRRVLKRWNWEVFGDLQSNIKASQQTIQAFENELQQGSNDEISGHLVETKKHLNRLEDWEAEMLSAKARLAWEKDGDRNTALYHACIKERCKRSTIQIKREDGSITTDPNEIGAIAESFFANLFKASDYHMD